MLLARSARNCAQASHDWVWVLLLIGEKWRKSFKPITKCSNAKPKQTRITYDTQVKTALDLYMTYQCDVMRQNTFQYKS